METLIIFRLQQLTGSRFQTSRQENFTWKARILLDDRRTSPILQQSYPPEVRNVEKAAEIIFENSAKAGSAHQLRLRNKNIPISDSLEVIKSFFFFGKMFERDGISKRIPHVLERSSLNAGKGVEREKKRTLFPLLDRKRIVAFFPGDYESNGAPHFWSFSCHSLIFQNFSRDFRMLLFLYRRSNQWIIIR